MASELSNLAETARAPDCAVGASPAIQELAYRLWTLSDHLPYGSVCDNAESTWVWFKLAVFSSRTHAELGLCVRWLGLQVRTPFRAGGTSRYRRWLHAAERATTRCRLLEVLHAASESALPHEAVLDWGAVNACWCNPPEILNGRRADARYGKALQARAQAWVPETAVPHAGCGGIPTRSAASVCLRRGGDPMRQLEPFWPRGVKR